jgi:hypothetical protein
VEVREKASASRPESFRGLAGLPRSARRIQPLSLKLQPWLPDSIPSKILLKAESEELKTETDK